MGKKNKQKPQVMSLEEFSKQQLAKKPTTESRQDTGSGLNSIFGESNST